jgi:hypothetical protein
MSNKINKDDLVEQGALDNLLLPLKEVQTELAKTDAKLVEFAKTVKTSLNFTEEAKSLRELESTMTVVNKAYEEKQKTQKESKATLTEIEKLQEKINKVQTEEAKTIAKLRQELNEKNKVLREEAKLNSKSISEYDKLSSRLNKMRKEYKELAVTNKENTKEGKELLRNITDLDTKLKSVDNAVGQNQRSVGKYSDAVKNATGVLAKFGLAMGGVAIVRDALNVVKDFEVANSQLASVLGVTTKETSELQKQQKELGASTSFTASQVAELQTELAKLGFTNKEIADSTEAVLNLAKASGTDLANASAIGGATLRAFGLDASEMGRVTDVMAKSFSTSALDIEKFKESMKLVAPIAKAAGVSLEDATAMMGTLANAGISGSNAGTALRRILSEVATTGKPVAEAMKEMAERGLDLADAEDEVGKNAMSALLILTENQKGTEKLSETYKDAQGSAKAMADEMGNNLTGALDRLRSAWEGQILGLNDTSGASNKLKDVVEFLANNLGAIVKVIGTLLAGFLAWKTTIIATKVATTLYTSAVRLMGIAMSVTSKGVQGANKSMQAFNATTKANPLGLLITLLATAVTAFIAFSDSATEAEKAQKRLNDAVEEGKELAKENIKNEDDLASKKIKQAELVAKTRIEAGEDEKKVNEELKKQKIDIVNSEIDAVQKLIFERKKQELSLEIMRQSSVSSNEEVAEKQRIQTEKTGDFVKKENEDVTKAQIEEYEKRLIALKSTLLDEKIEVKEKNKEVTKIEKSEQEKRAHELELLRRRLEDMQDASMEEEWSRRQQQLRRRYERERDAIKGQSQIEIDLRIALETQFLKESEDLTIEFRKRKISIAEDYLQKEIDLENEQKRVKDANMNQELNEVNEQFKLKTLALLESSKMADEIAKEENENLIQHLEEQIAIRKHYGESTTDLEIQLATARRSEVATIEKSILKTAQEISQAVADIYIQASDRAIESIRRQEDAHRQMHDTLSKLASEGNITAEQSLAKQIELQEEAQRKAMELERKKLQIQQAQQVSAIIMNELDAGKSPAQALSSAGLFVASSQALIASLPKFKDGTENTGVGGNIDKDGGFLAVLHKKERVMSAEDNSKVSGISNPLLADIGYQYKTGQLVQKDSAGSTMDLMVLRNELKSIKQAIENKPEIITGFEETMGGVFKMIIQEKKNGHTNTKIYKS